jgi:probable biosynthetic protein (TIGR04098 family)
MPHLDVAGLSENWLFRHAGELQWEAIGQRLGVPSDEIRGDAGARLYPTVVAVRARYDAPLAAVRENDVLDSQVEVVPCGRSCAHGRIVVTNGQHRFTLELLTTFAARGPHGLRTAPLAPALARRWTAPDGPLPVIARLARAARRGEPVDDPFAGVALARASQPLGSITYEPSPYADYNGAGLLYFASYVTIADSAERRLVRQLGLGGTPRDWALATSTVRRDVYYYENLPLGASLVASLYQLDRDRHGVSTHVRLSRAEDGRPMADVIARRHFTAELR